MSRRRNFLVRLLAKLLRPAVEEILDMGGRETPLPWRGAAIYRVDGSAGGVVDTTNGPAVIEIPSGGALFAAAAGRRCRTTERYLRGLGIKGARIEEILRHAEDRRHG